MTINTKDNKFVPANYQELYMHYIQGNGNGDSLCRQILRTMLPHETADEHETLAHDVFLRLQKFDILSKFDPKKSNFGGTIFFTCRTIVGTYLGRKSRNPITGLCGGSLVTADLEDETFTPGVYNMDRMFAPDAPDYEESMTASTILDEGIYWARRLAENPKNKRDESLLLVLTHLREGKDIEEIAELLGVTKTTIQNWISVIAEHLKEVREVIA